MKLVINYDFINKVKQAREPFGSFKIIKNNSSAFMYMPIYTLLNLVIGESTDEAILNAIQSSTVLLLFLISMDIIKYNYLGDIDREKAINDLRRLSSQLNSFNISTDMDLLLESKIYQTEYKVYLTENNRFQFLQEKYIIVPTYNCNGNIKDEFILQEHIIGSKDYVLSLGSPIKTFRPVFSNG